MDECFALCEKLEEQSYWKRLGDLATSLGRFALAEQAFWRCGDLSSLLLLGTCLADRRLLERVADDCRRAKNFSVGFVCYWTLGQSANCLEILLESRRYGEAAVFAKSYLPSRLKGVIDDWKHYLIKSGGSSLANRLGSPFELPESFPEISFLAEVHLAVEDASSLEGIPSQCYQGFTEEIESLDFFAYAKKHGIADLKSRIQGICAKYKAVV